MKRKLSYFISIICILTMLAGCASSKQTEQNTDTTPSEDSTLTLSNITVEDYVTLGEYKGLEVAMAPASVDEATWEEWVAEEYFYQVTAENGGVFDRAVENGDTVNIDYVGTQDGVAFSGGTAQGATLTIGSGKYIGGFEEGLIGVMPGETVELNLTFPENYGNVDLAGAEVVFTVTVNFIVAEMTDEIIAGFGSEEYSTVEELRQSVYDYLYEMALADYESDLEYEIITMVVGNCTISECPEEIVEQYKESITYNIETLAVMYGMDGETLINYQFGRTMEDYVKEAAEDSAKQALVLQAIANKEGLVLSEEGLLERIEEYALENGAESAEEMLTYISMQDFRDYFMTNDVIEFLKNNNTVVEQ